ncbi:MAG TPA: redoxin domain-containing protein [Puia sp.]|nr:redoxin domain-containing protein [Puia sp.]
MSRSMYKMVLYIGLILLPMLSRGQVHVWDPARGRVEWIKMGDKQPLRVLIFLSPECPLCQNYSLILNELQKKYTGNVVFTGIVPGKAYADRTVTDFIRKYKINFPVYVDSVRALSSVLQAKVTPEVYLLRTEKNIFYHGSIDNWVKDLGMQGARATKFYLRDAIDETLAGKPVSNPYNKPVGCLINDY